MYAIFRSGGKQHRVSQGQVIRLEKIKIAIGDTIEFNQIEMIVNDDDIQIGDPFIIGGRITAKIISHGRDEKIIIVKFQRRKHFRKHQGHRQWFTNIKITNITLKSLLLN